MKKMMAVVAVTLTSGALHTQSYGIKSPTLHQNKSGMIAIAFDASYQGEWGGIHDVLTNSPIASATSAG